MNQVPRKSPQPAGRALFLSTIDQAAARIHAGAYTRLPKTVHRRPAGGITLERYVRRSDEGTSGGHHSLKSNNTDHA